MSVDTIAATTDAATRESSTRGRVTLLAVALGATAVAGVVGGLLWPEPSGSGQTYSYADIASQRGLWWGLLMALAALQVCNVPLQALATMLLARRRGSAWATVGGAIMWVGCGLQAAGVAGWATAYFFPTDPSVDGAAGRAVVAAANADTGHLFALMIPGAVLVLVGTVLQCVGLFRARTVPVWVPVALLAIVLSFVLDNSGALGLVSSVPMAAGAIGLAYHARRSVA